MKTEKKELCEPTDNIGYCRASAASRCADKHQRQSRVRNTPSKCPGKIPRLPGRRGHKDGVTCLYTAGRQLRPSCARSGTISPSLAVTQSVKGRNHNRLSLAIPNNCRESRCIPASSYCVLERVPRASHAPACRAQAHPEEGPAVRRGPTSKKPPLASPTHVARAHTQQATTRAGALARSTCHSGARAHGRPLARSTWLAGVLGAAL